MDLRDQIARTLHLRRPEALRVVYWLQTLHSRQDAVHGECALVPYRTSDSVRSLVCTVDWDQRAIGCAWCGEWAADSGQQLAADFKLIVLTPTFLPVDVRQLRLDPAVLYCGDCMSKYREHFAHVFQLD